jgi:sulfate adenylyltransferase
MTESATREDVKNSSSDGGGPSTVNPGIRPHGGRLVNRILEGEAREPCLDRVQELPRIELNPRQLSDLEMIAIGAFSPLEGFQSSRDYQSVLAEGRLANGLPWTIPVTLAITDEQVEQVRGVEEVALAEATGRIVAVLHLEEIFRYDREKEAQSVLLTTSLEHPGVRYLQGVGQYCLAGSISLLHRIDRGEFANYTLDPKETRFLFEHRGWRTIVAFQTRNPVHRAHEYILKCALETVDGLLLHPLVGDTRDEDVPAEVRLRCYQALMGKSLSGQRVVLSLYPAAMRYAGPREAVFHAIARKNYGCTHFIVGRDAAGVGNFYGTYDAQKKFFEYEPGELGITPFCFDATFYCRKCGQIVSEKTCVHGTEHRLILSGTKVRELLRAGQDLPPEFTRPEVAAILREAYRRREETGGAFLPQ